MSSKVNDKTTVILEKKRNPKKPKENSLLNRIKETALLKKLRGSSLVKRMRGGSLLKKVFITVLLVACIAGGVGVGWAFAVLQDLPNLDPDKLANPAAASTIYNSEGEVLLSLFDGEDYRLPIEFDQISDWIKKAIVISEDKTFYQHNGINISGTLRAILTFGKSGGGSSITQQLARNVYLTLDVSMARKLREMALALELEKIYIKNEILCFYLNQVFFGHWAQGVQAGSQLYFGKNASDLNLAESAMLVAILPSPNRYSPYNDFETAKFMQELLLDLMLKEGAITQQEADDAKAYEVQLAGLEQVRSATFTSTYFVDYVLEELPSLLKTYYGSEEDASKAIRTHGLKIYTTLDSEAQASVEQAITDKMSPYQTQNADGIYQRQSAAVVIAPETGYIVAMAGGREYPKNTIGAWNRATDSLRQPGSSIKPIIDYAPGIAAGVITAATVFDDVPTSYPTYTGEPWQPTNFDDLYFGLISVREALSRSENIPAIKTMQLVGVDKCISFAQSMGLSSLVSDDQSLSAAIGGLTNGVSVLEMTTAYATFANNGVKTDPIAVLEVKDKNGVTIYQNTAHRTAVLDEKTAYIMTDLLKTVVSLPYGTGRVGRLGDRPVAAKSGTTDDFNDLWFCGYTKDYASVVWIGHDEQTPMTDLYGSGLAPKIWQQFMASIHTNLPIRDWSAPNDIEIVQVCSISGKRPQAICPSDEIVTEIFIKGTAPAVNDICNTHVQVKIDTRNGLLALPSTPSKYVATQLFIQRPNPLPYPLPYGNYPADAAFEVPKTFTAADPTVPDPTPVEPTKPGKPTNPGGH